MPTFDIREMLKKSYYTDSKNQRALLKNTNNMIGGHWNEEWSDNIKFNHNRIRTLPVLNELWDTYKGRPGLVVGAGPSIKENIEQVREAQQAGAFLVAVDRAFATLKEAGIKPDLTITTDAQPLVSDFFPMRLVEEDDKIAISVISHPYVYAFTKNAQQYIFSPINPFNPFWDRIKAQHGYKLFSVNVGFVVTFSAVDATIWLGGNPICVIGNELCWKTEEDMDSLNAHRINQRITNKDGSITIPAFFHASKAFPFFRNKYGNEIQFLDASGGMDIGWERIDIKEYINLIGGNKDEKSNIYNSDSLCACG